MLTALVGQAPTAGVWVTSTSRQGVAAASAKDHLSLVAAQLRRYPATQGPADSTSCKRRLTCLVATAKKLGAGWVVGVESARIVNQLIVKVSLLSVEEDGRTVATTVVEGTEAALQTSLGASVASVFGPQLDRVFLPPAPPPPNVLVAPPPPPQVLVTPSLPAGTPSVTNIASGHAAPPSTGTRTAGIVIGAVGLAGLVAAGALAGVTLDAVARRDQRCAPGLQCNDPTALALHDRAAFTQDLGTSLAIGGGAALVTGVVLFFIGAPADSVPSLSLLLGPRGSSVLVSSSF